jgi:prepilin-type N-terminal cleavage/methylation domain-containing protein
MRSHRSEKKDVKGFTLIELLIVVAIIAILAAIAVPNFLEAQTRSKISRAKADLRTLATALESYYTDNNSYTFRDSGDGQNYYTEGLLLLTTPIAYITSVPLDVFITEKDLDVRRKPLFELGSGNAQRKQTSGTKTAPQPGPYDVWMARSVGADSIDDTVMGAFPYKDNYSFSDPNYPGLAQPFGDPGPAGAAAIVRIIYDPSNGTVSRGDIFRLGGVKPQGQNWDVWFAASSR